MTERPDCECLRCRRKWREKEEIGPLDALSWQRFRYACEVCGNKRCPHHSDHRLACTNSNEPGQPGSIYA